MRKNKDSAAVPFLAKDGTRSVIASVISEVFPTWNNRSPGCSSGVGRPQETAEKSIPIYNKDFMPIALSCRCKDIKKLSQLTR